MTTRAYDLFDGKQYQTLRCMSDKLVDSRIHLNLAGVYTDNTGEINLHPDVLMIE